MCTFSSRSVATRGKPYRFDVIQDPQRSAKPLSFSLAVSFAADPHAGQIRLAFRRTGAGAVRFGFPSEVRGMAGVGKWSHCAHSGTGSSHKVAAIAFLSAA